MNPGASEKPIEELAASALAFYDVPPGPPIDLGLLAARMGVDRIERVRLVEDGRLEHGTGLTRVYLNSAIGMTRARFTLAHELGHLLLAKPNVPITARRMRENVNDEERFCDSFAAALLMPVSWIRDAGAGPRTLTRARWLSDVSECSLSAVVVRCNEILGWSRTLLHWRRDSGRWRLASAAGVPRDLHGCFQTGRDTTRLLDVLAANPRQITPVELPLDLGGTTVTVPAEVMPTHRGAIALADLGRLAEATRLSRRRAF